MKRTGLNKVCLALCNLGAITTARRREHMTEVVYQLTRLACQRARRRGTPTTAEELRRDSDPARGVGRDRDSNSDCGEREPLINAFRNVRLMCRIRHNIIPEKTQIADK